MNIKRDIREVGRSENKEHVFYGYLAEDYDGIGQRVSVALARSSTSSAFSARVAAGDFGTNQVIPAGTRITIISKRGQVEVISMGAK